MIWQIVTIAMAGPALVVASWAAREAQGSRRVAERRAAVAERDEQRRESGAARRAVSWQARLADFDTVELVHTGEETAWQVWVAMSPSTPGGPTVTWPIEPSILSGANYRVLLDGRGPGGWAEITWRLLDDEAAPQYSRRLLIP